MTAFHDKVRKTRLELEQKSLDGDLAEVVEYVTLVQEMVQEAPSWHQQLELFGQSQKLLEVQSF